ncbi:MAG: membrane protein insertion efficiency factor YidD [Desulfovermiculus sp.]
MRSLFIFLVRVYQVVISPLAPSSCRFIPTCSEYALVALSIHGTLRGLRLVVWRVLRCHPLAQGGYDPVPGEEAHNATHLPGSENITINPEIS